MSEFRQTLQIDADTDLFVRSSEDGYISVEVETQQGKVISCFELELSASEAAQVAQVLQLAVADCSMRGDS